MDGIEGLTLRNGLPHGDLINIETLFQGVEKGTDLFGLYVGQQVDVGG